MLNLINWLKGNLKTVLDFLKENFLEIHIKSKKTEETVKHIKVTNLFAVLSLLAVGLLVYGSIKLIAFLHL